MNIIIYNGVLSMDQTCHQGLFTQHIEQGIRFYITNLNDSVGNDQPLWEEW